MKSLSACRLYGILDLVYVAAEDATRVLAAMIEGGIDLVQLRAKGVPPSRILALARKLVPAAREAGVPFLLNDHPRLVPLCDADGAHVGQEDLSVAGARALAGPGKWIGKSTHSPAQARAAVDEGPDYIGFGPLLATPTKPDYPAIGLDDIRAVEGGVPVPVFCIGGIKRENLPSIVAAGARRVVIVSGILGAPDIAAYVRDCRALLPG